MTDIYIVTAHDGSGSMVEAADARHALGWFADPGTARAVAEALTERLCALDDHHAQQSWATVQTVYAGHLSADQAVRLAMTAEQAADALDLILQAEIEYWS